MIALIPVVGVVLVSLIVTRVATVILTSTGMSRENARFQARSALSGVGFTTAAAEAVVRHPVRRRVISVLMVVGSGGLVTALASLIVSFGHSGHRVAHAGWLLVALFFIWIASRSQRADRLLTRLIVRVLGSRGWLGRDYAALTRLADAHAVGELQLHEDDWLAGRKLGSLRLRSEGVNVLGVIRDQQYTSLPDGGFELRSGDTLYVYGPAELLEDLDRRVQGTVGEGAHRDACRSRDTEPAAQA
jgi:hypothetical protein